jgi:ribosomal protein S18 acetylase RimI-like enzyme
MRIRKIDTRNSRDVRKFIHFPLQLYKDNPYFCPSLEAEARFPLDREKHPFYKHSHADFYLAESEGQVIGRIAAVHNTRHNEYRQVKTAFFWAFDVVDDFQAAAALFEAVFDWARVRDRETVLGPRGLIGSDAAGVLVEGFDRRAVMGVPYNYPYYDDFIRSMGFEKLTDHLSGYLPASAELPPRIRAIAEKIALRRGYQVKDFSSKDEMRRWAPRVLAVHEEAFAGTHEWHPSDPQEMQAVADGLIAVADPRLIKLLLKDEKVVGFAFLYPDLSDAIRRHKGKMTLAALLDMQREARRTGWLLANGVGVLPAYQNLGADAVLYVALERAIRECGQYRHIDVVQVNETNFKSRSDMESLGVEWVKRHRSYTRQL